MDGMITALPVSNRAASQGNSLPLSSSDEYLLPVASQGNSVGRRRVRSPSPEDSSFDDIEYQRPSRRRRIGELGELQSLFSEAFGRVKEEKDAVHLFVEMPGLGMENVHLSTEQNILIIRAEGDKDSDDVEIRHSRYFCRYDAPLDYFKVDQIRATMMNGVLKVILPKVKEEDLMSSFIVNLILE